MLALLMALAAVAAAPSPEPAKTTTVSPVVVSPIKAPDIKIDSATDETALGDYVAIWPGAAYNAGADGHVTLNCKIDTHGLAEWCEVAQETPAGKGFGAAAVALRPTFKVTPAMGPDGPVTKMMSIRVKFRAPERQFDMHNQSFTGNPLAMQSITLLNNPTWAQAPDFDDLAQAYPAAGANVEGYVIAHCQVLRTGDLKNCFIAKEFPQRHGFAKAAMTVVHKFKVAPEWATEPHSKPLYVDIPIRMSPPSQVADKTVSAPKWMSGWDPASHPGVFPPEAAAKGLTTGRGVANCIVRPDGGMTQCAPEPGDPDGLGFSDAAVKLASLLKINLWSDDAGPVEGGHLRVAIRLSLPK